MKFFACSVRPAAFVREASCGVVSGVIVRDIELLLSDPDVLYAYPTIFRPQICIELS